MKCLRKYKWVKLLRSHLPAGKGLLGYWAKLASRAAFRKGNSVYCGHINPVTPGMWSGGVVGLKSILGVKKRAHALWIMSQLQELGYLTYTLDQKTKHLTYQITDWVVKCSGAECMDGAVYATEGYGFLCMPRVIPERLVGKRTFEEADAWLDLWCHTTYGDYGNAFSFLGPAIQYGKYGSVLTLDGLGKRWGWEKTKVWRFFKKHEDNSLVDEEVALVLLESTEVEKILDIQAVMIIGMEVLEKGVESPYQNSAAVYENRRRGIPVFDDREEEIRYLLQPEYKQFLQAGMQALNLC